MRLGFWNRLALVAWVLASVGGGTYQVLSDNNKTYKALSSGYQTCMKMASEGDGSVTGDFCYDSWLKNMHTWGVDDWALFVGVYALGFAVVYLIIWAAVATSKWVWRGRTQK